jgi:hypothetical protein
LERGGLYARLYDEQFKPGRDGTAARNETPLRAGG